MRGGGVQNGKDPLASVAISGDLGSARPWAARAWLRRREAAAKADGSVASAPEPTAVRAVKYERLALLTQGSVASETPVLR